MKELTRYNRVAGYFNKIYDMLNADFFNSEMERPVITIQSTPKAYGHFSLYEAWTVNGEGVPEINIGAGALQRPIEQVISTLCHEMVHQFNFINNVVDVSRGRTYHNHKFKEAAEAHGLVVERSDKYGWSRTSCSDELFKWILDNELEDIRLNRNEFDIHMSDGRASGEIDKGELIKKGSYRKYICCSCGMTVRATKDVNVKCGDCDEVMRKEVG